jgi:hypothetical protein
LRDARPAAGRDGLRWSLPRCTADTAARPEKHSTNPIIGRDHEDSKMRAGQANKFELGAREQKSSFWKAENLYR